MAMTRWHLGWRISEAWKLWRATSGVCRVGGRVRLSCVALSPRFATLLFGEQMGVRLAWLEAPVYLRPGTTDVLVFRQVFVEREYDVDSGLSNPGLIVDAGANIGLTSIFFALRFPECRIAAIEPSPDNFGLLVKNTRRLGNVAPMRAALWHENGTLEIRDPGRGAWAYQVGESSASSVGTVPATSMAALVAEHGHVDLLKLDIEGAELNVLSDAESWIESVSAIVVELHPAIHPECVTVFETATRGFDRHSLRGGLRLARRPRTSSEPG